MKTKLPWILLSLSVSFNVAILSGYLFTRSKAFEVRSWDQAARRAAEWLELSGDQRERFLSIHAEFRAAMRNRQNLFQAETDEFWVEVQKDDPDREKLVALWKSGESVRDEVLNEKLGYLLEMMKILDPAQRSKLVRMTRQWKEY